jgi:hypothetical protein
VGGAVVGISEEEEEGMVGRIERGKLGGRRRERRTKRPGNANAKRTEKRKEYE